MALLLAATAATLLTPALAQAQQCSSTIDAKYPAPSVASGYTARIVANGLSKPRGLMFDSEGHLLVVQSGYGITALTMKDDGGACLSVDKKMDVVKDKTLNHGIELSADGKTLYASNSDKVYSWSYSASDMKTSDSATTLVEGMDNSDHTTRTLLLSKKSPGTLLVSRGSMSNVDELASVQSSGHSQIRSFDIDPAPDAPYTYASAGELIGWGLRNSVGVAEEPTTGGIWSVENSVDDMKRLGKDVHENNPGEELNFHGFLNGTETRERGGNFGYPSCYAAWDVPALPENNSLKVGENFAIGDLGDDMNDDTCAANTISPRLSFPPHWAPLDIKFNEKGTVAWVTAHGSWNRDAPSGYTLFGVPFSNGQPTAPSTSQDAAIRIVSNPDVSRCPDACFRPVGLAWDARGRLFMTSDSTGEVYVVTRDDGSGVADMQGLRAESAPAGTEDEKKGGVGRLGVGVGGVVVAVVAVLGAVMW